MTKDQIKDRILRRAAKAWGFSDTAMETSFDPLMSLMINALSDELEKISYALQDSNSSVVGRILEIMFPESSIGAKPSQAILHASPVENNVKVSLLNQLTISKRIPNIYNPLEPIFKEIAFSPTLEVKLAACDLKYIAYGRNLYEVSNVVDRKAITDYNTALPSGEVFLGIEMSSPDVLYIEDLMLYIDIKEIDQKEMLQYYLKNMKCFYDDALVAAIAGYNVPMHNSNNVKLNKTSVHLSEITKEVNEFYVDNFYTLHGKLKCKALKDYNQKLECFEQVTSMNENPIIWIKMVFPESLIPQVIDKVTFQVNCFPAINKKRHKISKVIKNTLTYLRLNTEKDIYLDIENVTESLTNHYEIREFTDAALEDGTAVLRKTGTSKFDQRDATELIQQVLDLIKDESTSFSEIGKDFTATSFGEINRLLTSIYKQIGEAAYSKTSDPHLLIKPSGDTEGDLSFEVNYWSTSAEDGNDIKAGSLLEPHDKLFDSNKTIMSMTTSVGGLSKQSDQDKIFFYRNALLTRGRIVTIADIKAFSFNHFKNCISSVRVEKGTRKEISIKEGYSRTIDIYVKINKAEKEKLSASGWDYLCESYMKYLKSKSSNTFPYRLYEE